MTCSLQQPFLVGRATQIPTEASGDDRTVYNDERMMNVMLDDGVPTHSVLDAAQQGGTKKTGVDRETTDDS
jgi:hypothetical protein